MKKTILLLLLVLLVAGMAGCRDAETPTPAATTAPTGTPEEIAEPAEATATSAPAATPTVEPSTEPEPVDVELVRTENETMGLSVLVPEGWQEVAPGVYSRGESPTDLTSLIQQAAPGMSAEALAGTLQTQLGIEALPEPAGTLQTHAFEWTLYEIAVNAPPVGAINVDLAIAETETATYLVLLQTLPEAYPALHEAAFLPALEGFTALESAEESSRSIYEDPEGQFTVPLPANWTAEPAQQYVTLVGPEDGLFVHILVLEGEDPEAAVDEAWTIVDPAFTAEKSETMDIPTSAAGGIDEFVLVNYERGEDDPTIVQAEGRLYQGKVYVLLFVLDLEAYQRRTAQIQTIDTGFKITALEEVELSGVEPLTLSDELIAGLEAYITEQMAALETPGLAIAITQGGEVVYASGFGVRDLESGEPVTAETLMMVGSTTKPMTTMLMASLVDDGAVDWDTPVQEILPSFAVADEELSEQITMRNLVCACTGVPRRDLEWLFNSSELEAADVVASLADFEFFTDFGETFQYSNQMVATGGYAATLAAGGEMETLLEDYTALLQTEILGPLGMASSTFDFDAIAATDNHATPYGQTLLGDLVALPLSAEAFLLPAAPAGALWSNVLDMAQFAITNLNEGVAPGGERVVSAENLAVTWEPQVEISADASYGLGWIIEDYKGLQVLSHAGNTLGFTSELAFIPEADLGIAILTNQQAAPLNSIARIRLLELLYEQESEVDELLKFSLESSREALADLEEAMRPVPAGEVEPYLGSYTNPILGPITLNLAGETLLLDAGEFQLEIHAFEGDEGEELDYLTFTPPLAGLPVAFEMDAEGNPTVVLGTGLTEYTFTPAE